MAIALDAMAGDYGLKVLVQGAVEAYLAKKLDIILVGREEVLREELEKTGHPRIPIQIKHASQVVEMGESPSDSLRRKKDSTIRVAFQLVKQGEAEAVVSAGNSGATLATAMVTLGRINAVRPAIAALMPTLKKPVVMIDVGANVDCKPHHLFQFGIMGSVFSREFLGIRKPVIGLLSIGEEGAKGNLQVKRAYELFDESGLHFCGNVEGRDVFGGDVNVVVCDGFVGNICLKLSEGLAESILTMLKDEVKTRFMPRLGYALASEAFKNFRKKVDYSEYGGAPLLGVNGIAVICHGRSDAKAIKNALCVADDIAKINMVDQLKASLDSYKIKEFTD
jgi:glycerol-3-phosphate acyltransferase PlsX